MPIYINGRPLRELFTELDNLRIKINSMENDNDTAIHSINDGLSQAYNTIEEKTQRFTFDFIEDYNKY